jgi:hypothetical protein
MPSGKYEKVILLSSGMIPGNNYLLPSNNTCRTNKSGRLLEGQPHKYYLKMLEIQHRGPTRRGIGEPPTLAQND